MPVSELTNMQPLPPAQAVQPKAATNSVPSSRDEPVPQAVPQICNVCGYPPPQYRNNTERNVPCKQCGYVAKPNEPQFQRAVHLQGSQTVRNARAPVRQAPPLPTTNVPAHRFQPIAQSTVVTKPRLPVQHDGHGLEMSEESSIGVPRGQFEPPEHCLHCCFQPDAQRHQGGVFTPTRNAMQDVQQRPHVQNAAPAAPPSTHPGEPHRWQPEVCERCCSSRVADPAVVPDKAVVADQAVVADVLDVPLTTPVSYRLLDSLEPVPLGGFLGGGGEKERGGVGVGGATEFFLFDEKSGQGERWNLSPTAKYNFIPAQGANVPNLSSVAPAQANQAVQSVQQRFLNVPVPAQADKSRERSGVAEMQIPRQSEEPGPQRLQKTAVSRLPEAEAGSPSRLVPTYPQSERSQRQSFKPSEEPPPQLPQQIEVSGQAEARSPPKSAQSELSQLQSSLPPVELRQPIPQQTAKAEARKPHRFMPLYFSSQTSQVQPSDRSGWSTYDTVSSVKKPSRLRESLGTDPSRKTYLTAENRLQSPDSRGADASAALESQLPQRESLEMDSSEKSQLESEESSEIPSSLVAQLAAALQSQVPDISREFQSESPRAQEELTERLAALLERRKKLYEAYLLAQQIQSRLPEATDAATSEPPPVSVIVIQSPPGAKGRTSHSRTSPQTSPAQPQRRPQTGRSGSASSETSRQSGSPTAAQIRRTEDSDSTDVSGFNLYENFSEEFPKLLREAMESDEDFETTGTTTGDTSHSTYSGAGSLRHDETNGEDFDSVRGTFDSTKDMSFKLGDLIRDKIIEEGPDSTWDTSFGSRSLASEVMTDDFEPDVSSYYYYGNPSEEDPRLQREAMESDEDLETTGTTTGDTSHSTYSGAGSLRHDKTNGEVGGTVPSTKDMSVTLRDLIRDVIIEEDFNVPVRSVRHSPDSTRDTSVGSRSLARDGITEEDFNATGASNRGTPDSARKASAGLRSVTHYVTTEEDFNPTCASTPYSARNVSAGLRRVTRDSITEEGFSATSPDSTRNTSAGLRRLTRDIITEEGFNTTGPSNRGTPDSARKTSAGLRSHTRDTITEEGFSLSGTSDRRSPDYTWDKSVGSRSLARDEITEEGVTAASYHGTPESAWMTSPGVRSERSASPESAKGTMSRPTSAPQEPAAAQSLRPPQEDDLLYLSTPTRLPGARAEVEAAAAAARPYRSLSPKSGTRSMWRPTSTPRESAAAQSWRTSQADESVPRSTPSGRQSGSPTAAAERHHRSPQRLFQADESVPLSTPTGRESVSPTARHHRSPSPESMMRSMSRPTSAPRESPGPQSRRLSQADESVPLSTSAGRQSGSPAPASARQHRSPSPESQKRSMSRPSSPPRESAAEQPRRLSQADESMPTGRQSGSPIAAAARQHRRSTEDETTRGLTGVDIFKSGFGSPLKPKRRSGEDETTRGLTGVDIFKSGFGSPLKPKRRSSQDEPTRGLTGVDIFKSGFGSPLKPKRRSSQDESTRGLTGVDIFKSGFGSPLKPKRDGDENTTGRSSGRASGGNTSSRGRDETHDSDSQEFGMTMDSGDPTESHIERLRQHIREIVLQQIDDQSDAARDPQSIELSVGRIIRNMLQQRESGAASHSGGNTSAVEEDLTRDSESYKDSGSSVGSTDSISKQESGSSLRSTESVLKKDED